MAKDFKVEQADVFNSDTIIDEASAQELLNIEFNNEYDNIARDHKVLQILWQKVRMLEKEVARLREKK